MATSLIDSITTGITTLQKTPETKELAAAYNKQLEALVSTNKIVTAEYQQQLAKGEALRTDQDEFFRTIVIPELLSALNPNAAAQQLELKDKLKQFDKKHEQFRYENTKLIKDYSKNKMLLEDLYASVFKAFTQIQASHKEGINLPSPSSLKGEAIRPGERR